MTKRHTGHIRVGKTNVAILNGEEDVTLWDDEELIRGQRRAKNGSFVGRPPKVVPTAVHKEFARRQVEAVRLHLQQNLLAAAEALTAIVNNPEAEDRDKLKAIDMVFARILGKPQENVSLSFGDEAKPPWLDAIEGGIVSVPVDDADTA